MQEQHGPRLFTPETVILYHHELTYKGQSTSKQVKKQICILSSTVNSITSPLKLLFEGNCNLCKETLFFHLKALNRKKKKKREKMLFTQFLKLFRDGIATSSSTAKASLDEASR